MSDNPLFREAAIEWAAGQRLGDPPRTGARRTVLLYRVLALALLAGLSLGALVRVDTTEDGSLAVDGGTHWTAVFSAHVVVHPGDQLEGILDGTQSPLHLTVTAARRDQDRTQVVTGTVASPSAVARAGHAYARAGSESLLAYLLLDTSR